MSALVLALNPSIDAEWQVDRVQWEEKNIVRAERRWAGGKGVNVARWLTHLRANPRLVLPLGGAPGAEMAGYLRDEGITTKIVPLREPSRVNIIITTAQTGQMRFNRPGPRLSRLEWQRILREVNRLLKRNSSLILSGSLPRGLAANAYARLMDDVRGPGCKVILDCDGDALRAGVKAGPFLVKPNEHELAEWFGRELSTESTLARAAARMSQASGGWVLVSRGAAGGLLINDGEGVYISARPPKLTPRNTVGAGDALVAAVTAQIELGAAPIDWLRQGIAAGAAATQCPAGELPRHSQIKKLLRQVMVEQRN